ncbi:MAG TPA: hypothetical protein DIT01_03320 [Lentisphaeria bacterium]|nr:hypothetical protein [Lentisphaeria bacterium]|tara:strand:+ start:1762 stop:2487 length:726 start_codon:yes stop_codon:yes gene_type:complete
MPLDLFQLMRELADFDTALLANTINYIDHTPTHDYYMSGDIQSLTPTISPTVGVAVTCELDSSSPDNPVALELYWQQLEQIEAMDLPAVWIIKTVGERPDHECVIGDGMAKVLTRAGCIGVVSDGRVRDVAGVTSAGLAVYARGKCVHHTALRFTKINEPVNIGGITVNPGDVIHANDEGVIVVPPTCLEILPEQLISMRAFEHDLHRQWRRTDLSIADKRRIGIELFEKYGFTKFKNVEL